MTQKLTWEKPGQDDGKFRRYLVLAMLRSGVCVTLQDSRSDYLFIANLLDCWSVDQEDIPDDVGIFGEPLASRLIEIKEQVRRTKEKHQLEATVGSENHFLFIVEAIPSIPLQTIDYDVMTTIIDLSEERHREKVLRTLLREVSHRSKNLLAIIQSIASQTARYSDTLEGFLYKFRGRLYSLSHSQDLITDSSWNGVFFRDLVNQQTTKYLPESGQTIEVTGENILLSPNASLHVGLALHELIVNAVSHGALATGELPVALDCHRIQRDYQSLIVINWTESRGELVGGYIENAGGALTIDKHFGSAVLERVVPNSVSGIASYNISPAGVSYHLEFPVEES